MLYLSYTMLALHFCLLTVLCLFGIHRLSMVWRWLRYRNTSPPTPMSFGSLPKVTIQIPLYNEKWVAERIIHAVARIDYPADKLQIQIVDDSTDQTRQLVAAVVHQYASEGVDIQHVHRSNREGYKAGALKDAMFDASGEFIAIFDADFIPHPSIIKDSINQFSDEKVAMIQFRWEHLNRFDSMLTETQAMMLDAHFSLEQHVRYATNALFNFNGTAGIWRAKAIIDAGNWSADTLTEDLDLSYRAQLKGWELVYLNDVACPGELPADMNAFKGQQHRWAKGGIQVMKKMLGRVWQSKIKLRHKIESSFHLSNNLAYFVMLADTTLFLVPSLLIRDHYQLQNLLWFDLPLLLLASGGHLIYFFMGQVALGKSRWRAFRNMPRVLLLGIQLAFNNASAAVEALRGKPSEFVRTPKVGVQGFLPIKNLPETVDVKFQDASIVVTNVGGSPQSKSFSIYKAISPKGGGFEILLAIVYAFVFMWGINHDLWLMLPFLFLLIVGFLTTAVMTLKTQFEAG